MDLSEQLDDAIGHGPVPPPVAGTVAAGRRALLLRRLATAGSALAVVAVVAVTGALVVPGTPAADVAPDLAPDPAAPPRVPTSKPSTGEDGAGEVVGRMHDVQIRRWRPSRESARGVRLTTDGRVVARDGATILEQVANPLDREPPRYSAAVAVRRGDSTDWYLLDRSPRYGSVSSWGPWGSYASFSDWVDDQVRLARGEGAG